MSEPLTLDALEAALGTRFPQLATDVTYGELTVHATPDTLLELVTHCRDDEDLSLRLLADLSGVHWPAGDHAIPRQPATTGWPVYRVARDHGVIEVLYVLRSLQRNHRLRISVATPDTDPVLPSATGVFPTAAFHEREVYDMFGVRFEGHPNLTRILMPDEWIGHPQRKDYPLGGVDTPYEHDKFIPPPDRRDLRDVVGGDVQ
jgi:NADH-quinone oxidoreductase subunit C